MTTKNFEYRHPTWVRFRRRWEMAYDFWRGGLCVLEPDHDSTEVRLVDERTSGTEADPEPSNSESVYSWKTVWSKSYLWKHERETINEYDDRAMRLFHLPLFQYIVNTLSAGVLRTKADRDGVDGKWLDIHKDIDLVGTDINAFVRRALSLALVFGRVHAVTDRPADGDALNKAQQGRAYAYLITPLDLVDWNCDERGRMMWGVVREDAPSDRQPGQEPQPVADQFRVWHPDRWELYREDREGREKYIKIGEGKHRVGRVPISTLYATKTDQVASFSCESPLADFLDLNRYELNKLSELDENERTQTWSYFCVPTVDGQIGKLDIGQSRAIAVPAESGSMPQFVSPDAQHSAGKIDRIERRMFLGRGFAGVGRGKSEYSKEERSAAALSIETEDKRNQLAWWSKALNEFDEAMHRDLAAWEGVGEDAAPTATYPTNYDVKATMTAIAELLQLASVPVMAQALSVQAATAKPILRKMLGEGGMDEADVEEVLAGLDEAIEKAEKQKEEQLEAMKEAAKQPGNDRVAEGQQGKRPPFAPKQGGPQAKKDDAK